MQDLAWNRPNRSNMLFTYGPVISVHRRQKDQKLKAKLGVEASVLIPALGRQREMDLCKFKDGQGYVVKPCLKKSTSSMLTWLGSS